MKIAFLHDDFPPHHAGGSGIVAHNLAKNFAHSGHTVLVITATQDRGAAGQQDMDGFRVVRLFSNYHDRWRAYLAIYNPSIIGEVDRLLKDFSPDIVNAHNVHHHLSYYSLVVARRYARVYLTAHDAMSFHFGKFTANAKFSSWKQFRIYKWRYNPFRNAIIRRILQNNVDKVIAVSDALKKALEENGIRNVSVIHNGIDADAWKEPQDVASFKRTHALGDSVILFGGRLSAAKGALQILEALALVVRSVPSAQLLVIGQKDAYAERMLVRAKELGIADRIVFTGWISGEELRKAYYASSVVAVPSLYLDPFPTVNLEAMACSKPVVATCFGGSPEIIEDDVTGFVVDPSDVQVLSARISDLLVDKEKNIRFGHAGYTRVVKEFSLTDQVQAYERLFAAGQHQ